MNNIVKLKVIHTYPSQSKIVPAISVGFFLEPRLDRYGNILKKINITDKFGKIHNINYSGQSLMISVNVGKNTTSIKRATRNDLSKYKEAFDVYLNSLDIEDRKLHEEKLYLFLEELPPYYECNKESTTELDSLKSELEKVKKEFLESKSKSKSKSKELESEELEKEENK